MPKLNVSILESMKITHRKLPKFHNLRYSYLHRWQGLLQAQSPFICTCHHFLLHVTRSPVFVRSMDIQLLYYNALQRKILSVVLRNLPLETKVPTVLQFVHIEIT